MCPRPPRSKRTATPFPYTTLFRSPTSPILTPGLAAKAQVAAINAAGGGQLMAAGIDIDGTLTATVHSNVTLDFKSSQIKNTVLDTTYRHYNDVTILAKDVRLTAASIAIRSEEHTSELQSLMRISYAVFCLKKKRKTNTSTLQLKC